MKAKLSITALRKQNADLLACLKEMREACASCFRVIAVTDVPDNLIPLLQAELKESGVADGFGLRADAAIAKAEGRTQ